MYLARKNIKSKTHYYIRDTYQDGSHLKSRDVFYLGTDPSRYIIYASGHGYYFDEVVEDTLEQFGLYPDQNELEHIFWDFLDPEIKRVIIGFQRSSDAPESTSQDMPRRTSATSTDCRENCSKYSTENREMKSNSIFGFRSVFFNQTK